MKYLSLIEFGPVVILQRKENQKDSTDFDTEKWLKFLTRDLPDRNVVPK